MTSHRFQLTNLCYAAAACIAIGFAVSLNPSITAAAVGVLVASIALSFVARDWLPALALLAVLFVPTTDLPLPSVGRELSVGVIPLAVWIARSHPPMRRLRFTRSVGAALGGWLLLSEIFAPIRSKGGVEWLLMMLASVVLVAVAAGDEVDISKVRRLYVGVTSGLGVLAVLETYALRSNLLYGGLYARATPPLVQHWSHYRATTLLGHPLVNATVFASALALTVSHFVSRRRPSWLALLQMLCLVGGLAATDSRGGALAAGVGILVALVFSGGRPHASSRRLIALAITVVAAGLNLC